MAMKAWMLHKSSQGEDADDSSSLISQSNEPEYTEIQCDERVLYDVNTCVPSDTLGRFITHDIFDEPRAVKTETESYAIVWNLLNDGHKYPRISYGTKIYAYHFRLADVCNTIHDGLPYKGRVRIGVERMPNFPTVPSDKLDVVIYDHDGGVIAKVRANDWWALQCHVSAYVGRMAFGRALVSET